MVTVLDAVTDYRITILVAWLTDTLLQCKCSQLHLRKFFETSVPNE